MDKIRYQRDEEIKLLQSLHTILHQTKEQLHNDLTNLAIKNLPMMGQEDVATVTINLSQSSSANSQNEELEPLDLDL